MNNLCIIFYHDKYKNLDLHSTVLKSEINNWLEMNKHFKVYEILEITETKSILENEIEKHNERLEGKI